MHKQNPTNAVGVVAVESFAAALYVAARWLLDESIGMSNFWFVAFRRAALMKLPV